MGSERWFSAAVLAIVLGACQEEPQPEPGGDGGSGGAVGAGACGDGVVDPSEVCDDGAANGSGSCTLTCEFLAVPCPEGNVSCAGECVDLQTDLLHCGVCATACPVGSACTEGECVPDTCRGVTCPNGATCVSGTCACTDPLAGGHLLDCGSGCVDLEHDENHCGACGAACPSGEVCDIGVCHPSCRLVPDVCPPSDHCLGDGTCSPDMT